MNRRLFNALDEVLYLGGFQAVQNGITVKIGNSSETAAHYRMQGPLEVLRFLEWLAKTVSASSGRCPVARGSGWQPAAAPICR
jgi:hypothetical protein